jgi:hypothetical protein
MTQLTDNIIISDMPVDLSAVLPRINPGFDWVWAWYVLDDNDQPEDTTGWTAEIDIRETVGGPLIKKLSTATGEIVNTPSAGRFDVSYLAVETKKIHVRQIVFDVKEIDGTGGTDRILKGTIPVDDVVTR